MVKPYRTSVQTQQKILQYAIDLFNEHGTEAVSTNLIADAASISSGNLYYHFHNKGEIIRAIFEQMILDWNALYQPLVLEKFDLDTLRQFLQNSFDLLWKYRFFYRELVVLLRKDEQLRQRYQSIQQQRLTDQTNFVMRLAERNARPFSENIVVVNNALRAAWILSDSWILHLETMGQTINEHAMQDGVALILQILEPYLATQWYKPLR